MNCKYCFFNAGRHGTWCPNYEYFTKEEQERQRRIQYELIRKCFSYTCHDKKQKEN